MTIRETCSTVFFVGVIQVDGRSVVIYRFAHSASVLNHQVVGISGLKVVYIVWFR